MAFQRLFGDEQARISHIEDEMERLSVLLAQARQEADTRPIVIPPSERQVLDGDAEGPLSQVVVVGIQQIPVPAPVAGDDGYFLVYDHNNLTYDWLTVDHNILSDRHLDADAADTPANGDVLTFRSADSKWHAAPPDATASGGGIDHMQFWRRENIGANTGTSYGEMRGFDGLNMGLSMGYGGYILGVSIDLEADLGGAGLEYYAQVYLNGVATGVEAVITGAGGTEQRVTASGFAIPFSADDVITVYDKRVGAVGSLSSKVAAIVAAEGWDGSTHNLLSDTHADTVDDDPAAGDLIYANATPKWTRLAKGTDGEVLTLVSGLPSWETPSGGGTTIIVQEGDSDVDTAAATLDFLAADFDITSSPSGEANVALASLLGSNARVGVRLNSTGSTFTRRRVNFIAGTGMHLAHADDSGNEEVDLTITRVTFDYGLLGAWYWDDTSTLPLSASKAPIYYSFYAAANTLISFPMPFAGVLDSVAVAADGALATGEANFNVFVNGSAVGDVTKISAAIPGTEQYKQKLLSGAPISVAAGDLIDIYGDRGSAAVTARKVVVTLFGRYTR